MMFERMLTMEPESQPLSTVAAIGLAGLTAVVVIGGGVFIAERGGRPGPPAVAVPPRPPIASASAAPPVEASEPAVTAKAAPITMTSSAAAAPSSPDQLPPQVGYLTVRGKGEARVYVNGVDLGPLNQALKAPCGLKYVRLGTATKGAHPPSWLSPGQSVAIACRAATEIAAPAGR